MHSTESEREKLFAPVDGIYQVNESVIWAADSDGLRQIFLRKKSVGNSYATDVSAAAVAPSFTAQSISALIPLDEGDYVDARVLQESGGGELAIRALGTTPVVSMAWVAPQ